MDARDIDELAEAGLSDGEVLRAATSSAGDFVRQEVDGASTLGWIVEGGVADLVLVEGDPRANRSELRTPTGVMVRGRWYSRAELDGLLRRAATPLTTDPADR